MWVLLGRYLERGRAGGTAPVTRSRQSQGPLPSVPLCFPEQPSFRSSHAPRSFTLQSLSKCCSLSLEHFFLRPQVSVETDPPEHTH